MSFLGKKSKLKMTAIERAFGSGCSEIRHVRINHRRAHVIVAEEFLHRADVVTHLLQLRREAVPDALTPFVTSRCVQKVNLAEAECNIFFMQSSYFFQRLD